MEDIINLECKYYLKNVKEDLNNIKLVDINTLKPYKISKNEEYFIKIDFKTIDKNDYKKILKKILHNKNKILKNKSSKLLGYVYNYDNTNTSQKEFLAGIDAIFFKTRKERYNYIYDTTCNYLDSFFYGKNFCDFKDNKCGEKRNTNSLTGCCHHNRIRFLGPLTKLVQCEYLDKNTYKCNAKCISCKLFTCDYLEKKGIKFRIKDMLLLDTFFNPLQKYCIKYKVFTPKEKIIKWLIIL